MVSEQIENSARRRSIRIQPELKKPILVGIQGEGNNGDLNAFDISDGGICVYISQGKSGYKIDEKISLTVTLPDSIYDALPLTGLIRHVGNDTIGVVFLTSEEESQKKILEYINSRIKDHALDLGLNELNSSYEHWFFEEFDEDGFEA